MLRSGATDQFLADALPVLDTLVFTEYGKHDDVIPKIFNVHSSGRWGEQTTTMAGVSAAVEKTEGSAVSFSDPIQGYDATYVHLTFAIATSFSRELIEDNRLDMVQKTYRSLGMAMFQTRQIQAMSVINDGYSTTNGPDGDTLFSISHALINGASVANRPTSDIAISVAGFRDMEVNLRKQTNHRSINVMIQPKVIGCPPDIMHTAMELIKSQDRPDTANRAVNTFYGNYELCVSPFLTSTTAWFALADKSSHELMFFERIAPEVDSWKDNPTGDVNTQIRSRFSVGYADWIGAWGTSG